MRELTNRIDLSGAAILSNPTPFESLGAEPVIDALVERFYAEMDARPEARGSARCYLLVFRPLMLLPQQAHARLDFGHEGLLVAARIGRPGDRLAEQQVA